MAFISNYKKINNKKYQLLLSFFLSLFIILFAVKLTLMFKPLYYYDIDNLNIVEKSGYGKSEIVKNYDYLVKYLLSYDKENKEFKLPTIEFSEYGKIHFEDVKNIFTFVDILLLISLIVSIIGINFYKKRKKTEYIKYTYRTLIVLPVLLMSSFYINFDMVFEVFHKIFFSNDYWVFSPKIDPIIKILPQKFFMHSAIMIITIIIVCGILLILLHKKITRSNSLRYTKSVYIEK